MKSETIVALYDTPAHAETVIRDLVSFGVPRSNIEYYSKAASSYHEEDKAPVSSPPKAGFWNWLTGNDTSSTNGSNHTSNTDHSLYDQNIEKGGMVVTVITDANNALEVMNILEAHNPINLDDSSVTKLHKENIAEATPTVQPVVEPIVQPDPVALSTPVEQTAVKAPEEQVLALHEEQLVVGKREVAGNTTRVRRYTVERPVEEQIRLREEHVNIYRRPASGEALVGVAADDAFSEKVVELTLMSEQAVIGKTTHVVEEIVLNKEATDRVETIRDTVRKEEVDVHAEGSDHVPNPSIATSTPATTGTVSGTANEDGTTFAQNHPNLAHPVETVKDKIDGQPTPAEKQDKSIT